MSKYSIGDSIIEQSTGRIGTISDVKPYGRGRQLYTVIFSDGPVTVLEQNITSNFNIDNPYERCKRGLFETCSKFKVVNTTYKINNSNNNTISSLKASKTMFKEYQFKPLLKFLESSSRRILIADEVGLGKTIEAGHIMLELKARNEFKSALIICPQSLKLKWQTELKEKFGLSFKIYESLNDAVEDLRVHPHTARGILNYEKIRIPKKEEFKKSIEIPSNILLDYLKTGQRRYSFILCDEAHKMRNSETQTYKGSKLLLDFSDSVVFLTATPIMLGESDLYNLLHLLEPHNFNNKSIFKNLINLNKPFIEALALLNKKNVPLSKIEEVLTNSMIEIIYNIGELERTESILIYDEYKDIPLYEHILNKLKEQDSLSLRAKLQMDISSMSRINNIFSRTRKREIAIDEREKNERNAHKEVVILSEEEQLLNDEVVRNYEEYKGIIETEFYEKQSQGTKLGLYALKRMLSSSIIATKLWRESNGELLKFEKVISEYVNQKDSKFNKLSEIIYGVKKTGAAKLIVFSIFKFTIKYLYVRLVAMGIDCYVIHGDISEREQIIQQFKKNNNFSILLSNEVGSEGLDMQFCSHMVNYDLPWNPMVIEQRIGRIDRFGQKAPKIHIYNIVVKNSILEIIYDRLLERIGIFKGVIGELEMILEEHGDRFNKLEKEMYETSLTREEQEAKVNDIAKAMETAKINLDKVEEGLTNTLTNDFYFKNEINKIRSKKLYVTENELLNYISSIIEYRLPTCEFKERENGCYYMTFPRSTPNLLPNFLTENQPIGEECDDLFRVYIQQLKEKMKTENSFVFTFNQELAFDRKDIDYVNIYNPIIIATSNYFKNKISSIGNTFKLKLDKNRIDLKPGIYFMSIYVISITTISLGRKIKSDILVPIVYDVKSDTIIMDKDRNRDYFGLLQSNGEDLLIQEDIDDILETSYQNMESDFTEYITNYINHQKKDIKMRADSQRELYIRQTNEYYRIRKEIELKNVKEAESNVMYLTGKEKKSAENILRLAQNRLKMLDDAHISELEKLNNVEEPILIYKLLSLCKFKVI